MRLLCSICTDVFDGCSDISVVPCGHMFHGTCLGRWISQNMTCPQCRLRVTHKSIINKLFLNLAEAQDRNDGPDVLQLESELEAARLAIGQSTHEKNCLAAEKTALEGKISDMTQSCKVLEGLLQQEVSNGKTLKKELRDCQNVKQEAARAREETARLKKQLTGLQNVQAVINGCDTEIEAMIRETSDVSQLVTWCCVYKQELERKRADFRELKEEERKTKKELDATRLALNERTTELNALQEENRNLKDVMAGHDQQIIGYMKKIEMLEAAIDSPSNNLGASFARRMLHESPAPYFTPGKCPRLSHPDTLDLDSSYQDLFVDSPVHGGKNHAVDGVRSKPSDVQPLKMSDMKIVTAAVDCPLGRKRESQDAGKNRVNLWNLNILKNRQPFAGSGVGSSSAVFRKGYNGLGGHETHISPRKRPPSSQVNNVFKKPNMTKFSSASISSRPVPPLPKLDDFDS